MIYLSFNVPTRLHPLLEPEHKGFREAGMKLGIEVVEATPWTLFSQKKMPVGVYNMTGIVNSSHFRFLKTLELAGVNVINKIEDTQRANDKFLSSQICQFNNILVPKILDLNLLGGVMSNATGAWTNRVRELIGFPCVIKSPLLGYGQGSVLCKNESDFNDFFGLLAVTNPRFGEHEHGIDFFVQEFISNNGQICDNYRINVFKGKVISAAIRKSSRGQWKNNQALSESQVETTFITNIDRDVPAVVIEAAEKVAKIFNLKFTGLDFLISDRGYFLHDINSPPGFWRHIECNYKFRDINNIFEEILLELVNST
jgi:glutathione synthase/RimK-type ligase-like ATP-grasp enzyme